MEQKILIQYLTKVSRQNSHIESEDGDGMIVTRLEKQKKNNHKLDCLLEMLRLELECTDE